MKLSDIDFILCSLSVNRLFFPEKIHYNMYRVTGHCKHTNCLAMLCADKRPDMLENDPPFLLQGSLMATYLEKKSKALLKECWENNLFKKEIHFLF